MSQNLKRNFSASGVSRYYWYLELTSRFPKSRQALHPLQIPQNYRQTSLGLHLPSQPHHPIIHVDPWLRIVDSPVETRLRGFEFDGGESRSRVNVRQEVCETGGDGARGNIEFQGDKGWKRR